MQENANNNEDEWEEWDMNEAESKKETTDLESSKLSCETEAVSNKYESANQQKTSNLDLEQEEVHLATTAADEPIAKSEIEQKDDGDLEEQQDNDQAIDMQLKQHNGLELILKEYTLISILLLFQEILTSILLCIFVFCDNFCPNDE